MKFKLFISSVQKEFAKERAAIFDYVSRDFLFGQFFEPFMFEQLPAHDGNVQQVFLKEATDCDIYLGLFGNEYGHEDADGVSPTEREYDAASANHRYRIIFIHEGVTGTRHPKEQKLIAKIESEVVRKAFRTINDLKGSLYASLIRFLAEKEILRSGPFDTCCDTSLTWQDLDAERIHSFVHVAKIKRNFALSPTAPVNEILKHLDLIREDGRVTNAAVLLFYPRPQRFFPSIKVKCAQFYGTTVDRPMPALKQIGGTLFEQVDGATQFVLEHLDMYVGDRNGSNFAETIWELPKDAVFEAIVNAVCHQELTTHASVQIMLFKDRLEVWNPGRLSPLLTLQKLTEPHSSQPTNEKIAEMMYLYGNIEEQGTGTLKIMELCKEANLQPPEFQADTIFKTIIRRPPRLNNGAFDPKKLAENNAKANQNGHEIGEKALSNGEKALSNGEKALSNGEKALSNGEKALSKALSKTAIKVIRLLENECGLREIATTIQHSDLTKLRRGIMASLIEAGFVELTQPDSPRSPTQKYRLTEKGRALLKDLVQE